MSSRKFLYELCIFYMVSLLGCPFVFAQTEACIFSDSDIEGVEVIQIGDRQVYTLFTDHLSDQPHEISAVTRSHTPEDAVPLLNQFLERYQERITSEQFEFQRIMELAESGQIDWIGVEQPQTAVIAIDSIVENYLENRDFISLEFDHLPEWDTNKTTQLFFLLYHPNIIVRGNHPEIFRKIRSYSLEKDENLRIASRDRLDDFGYWENLVIEDPRVTPYQYLQITSIESHGLITESDFEILLDRLRIPEEPRMTRINIRMLRMVYNDLISLVSRRDVDAVQSILDLPDNGNGLVLFGTTHGPGIKQNLISACQNGNGSP